MLRAFALALTLTLVGPAAAVVTSDDAQVAQQTPPPQTPKHDCERKSEGISEPSSRQAHPLGDPDAAGPLIVQGHHARLLG